MDTIIPVGQIKEAVNVGTLDDITEFFESLIAKDEEEGTDIEYNELDFND